MEQLTAREKPTSRARTLMRRRNDLIWEITKIDQEIEDLSIEATLADDERELHQAAEHIRQKLRENGFTGIRIL